MKWYKKLFENYAQTYENEIFTKGTQGECDFIETEIGKNKQTKILDIGCGTGRHAIELAKRGYAVTGIDLSENMIARASAKAQQQNLSIDLRQADARNLDFQAEFDLAIMLCEGGFPLMETDEMNFEILKNAAQALKTPGKLIFTTLNGLFPLFHSVKDFLAQQGEKGNATYADNTFDLMTFRDFNTTHFTDDSGQKQQIASNERYYVPPEITWLLKTLNFSKTDIYGAKLGAFSREHKLTTEDYEMLVVAEK